MRILIFFFTTAVGCLAQDYPRWFLEPVNLECANVSAGCSRPFLRRESSDSAAYLKACENLAFGHRFEFCGGEAFWHTEAGVFWMGNNFRESTDSVYLRDIVSRAIRLDSYHSDRICIVLASAAACPLPDSMLSVVKCIGKMPGWVETIPQDQDYVYAEGVAREYFYESSSWEEAERRARFNLARSIRVSMRAMQKADGASGQEVRDEEVMARLTGAEVVYRWRDVRRSLYFVLMRVPFVQN